MEHFIAAMLIGGVALYFLYHVALMLYFLGFGDDGFSWAGLGNLLIVLAFWAVAAAIAFGIGTLVLGAF